MTRPKLIAYRVALLVAATVLAVPLVQYSLVGGVRRVSAALALTVAPQDARANAIRANELITGNGSLAEAQALALRAARRDATVASAPQALALIADTQGRRAQAAGLMRFSERASRREFGAQLWLIEDAVRRNDVPGALRHYDIALRVRPEASALLFPILINGMAQDEIATGLVPVLKPHPVWRAQFLMEVAYKSPPPAHANAVRLFAALGLRSPGEAEPVQRFVERMATEGDYAAAWNAFRILAPAARRTALRDLDFRGGSVRTPFGWTLSDRPGATVDLLANGPAGGMLSYEVGGGGAGPLAQQLLVLPPGSYRLATRLGSRTGAAQPVWQVICATPPNAILVRLDLAVPTSAATSGFVVPPSCAAQRLVLVAPDATEKSSGTILEVTITPQVSGA